MELINYKHTSFDLKLNKNRIPINNLTFENLEEFNNIYFYARDHFQLVKATQSQGISNNISERFLEKYIINKGNQRFELIIICAEGCYRFILQNKKHKDNEISGQDACRVLYSFADKYNIDLSKYAVKDGFDIKKEIERPHIEVLQNLVLGIPLKNVYHMDFKSSYASRICEAYPELRLMYIDIYNQRKDNNGFYKHVLTNSIGCWQSAYCVDYKTKYKTEPYQFANLSKIAINGTRAKIEKMIKKLENSNRVPLLTNTDGIWYYSERGPYHDEDEGNELGNWENDHIDCEFLMTGPGAYQYVEDGVCHTVVRGLCDLDAIEPDRDKWQFGDIKKIGSLWTYTFDEKKGVYKTNG